MKHILSMDVLPRYNVIGPNYIDAGGGGSKRYDD